MKVAALITRFSGVGRLLALLEKESAGSMTLNYEGDVPDSDVTYFETAEPLLSKLTEHESDLLVCGRLDLTAYGSEGSHARFLMDGIEAGQYSYLWIVKEDEDGGDGAAFDDEFNEYTDDEPPQYPIDLE